MVGHLVPRGRRPLLDAALDEGRIVREGDPEWREEVPVRVESIPVRREGRVLGRHRPQHQPAHRPHAEPARTHLPPERLRPRPDDRRRVLPVPRPAGRHGRLAARRRRSDPARRRRRRAVRQPQRACPPTTGSAWPPTSSATTSAQTTAELAPSRGPVDEALVKLASGWAPAGVRGRGRRRRHPAARHPAQAQGRAHRFAGPAPRRHRTAPPRAGADHQGRHHPGDPPPGEEQPPDGGGPAAAPGPPDGLRARAARRSTRRCGASVRSPSCTRRCPRTWTSGSSSTRSPTG